MIQFINHAGRDIREGELICFEGTASGGTLEVVEIDGQLIARPIADADYVAFNPATQRLAVKSVRIATAADERPIPITRQ